MFRLWTILFLLFFFHGIVCAQHREDELLDSAFIYKKLEDFSSKRKFTHLLYGLIFRPVNPRPSLPSPSPIPKPTIDTRVHYEKFEGKIIRNIDVVTYDPFGYDTKDTSVKPQGIIPKGGNVLHVKTWTIKIRNTMIIKKYDTFDSLRVKESERLIRSQGYVREVFLFPVLTKGDSVDIYVRVYDVWSILVLGDLTTSYYAVDGRDKNFLGTGHQFQGKYKQNYIDGKNMYFANYFIPNIYNTYINSNMRYYTDENKNTYESIALNRPFFSVFTSWAGGAAFQKSLTYEILYGFDSTAFKQRYRSTMQDYWIGRSWQLVRGHSEERRATSFVSSFKYSRLRYQERAPDIFDTLRLHANEDFYLAEVGLSKRLYKQDNYIFRYGYVEDVPTGRAYSVVTGYQLRDGIARWYAGARVYMANYHNWGYFNVYFEYGTFFRNANTEEGSFYTGINYFSNLQKIGRWKFRQFIKPQYAIGFDRKSYEHLTLDNDSGIKGFTSSGLAGSERFTFTFQLQSYAPWNILGFRFGPFAVCSFGMLGTEKSGFSHSPLYSSFGIGLLVKNEYLILNTFQVSLAYYPTIPGAKNNVFKVNPLKTTDFGLRGFEIAEPTTVSYR